MKQPPKINFIFLIGPSASGKTHTVKNKLLGKTIGNITFDDQAISIDGGDVREASDFYQEQVTKIGIAAHEQTSGLKKEGLKILYQNIKGLYNKPNYCQSNRSVIKIERKNSKDFSEEAKNTEFQKELLCFAMKNKSESNDSESNDSDDEKFGFYDDNYENICKKNPCKKIKNFYINNNLSIIFVETLGKYKIPKFEDMKSYFFKTVFDEKNINNNTIYVLNLSFQFICYIQGKLRQESEGKAFTFYPRTILFNSYKSSLENSFTTLIKNKKSSIIVFNMGKYFDNKIIKYLLLRIYVKYYNSFKKKN